MSFQIEEATIQDIQTAFESGELTAKALVLLYFNRIANHDKEGLKPTVGLISRSGILPISYSQDTAGPMARTVTDAVLLLNALLGDDVNDPVMGTNQGKKQSDYTVYLDKNGLKGARIGIPRDYFFEELTEEQLGLFNQSVENMKQLGAVIIESADIKTARQIVYSSVLLNEFKSAIHAYLSRLGPHAPMKTLKDIIDFNHQHPMETLKYGQSLLIQAEYTTSGTLTETHYIRDRTKDLLLCQTEGIDAVMEEFQLDALLFPADFGSRTAARAGYPSIVVPSGYTAAGVPFGVTFTAKAYSEPTLIKLAYAYEKHSKVRKAPSLKSLL